MLISYTLGSCHVVMVVGVVAVLAAVVVLVVAAVDVLAD